jgi:hypothetical protein
MTATEKYKDMLREVRSAGLNPTVRALRELYGEAGEIIHALQREIDKLEASRDAWQEAYKEIS